jgi:hypothetical protein
VLATVREGAEIVVEQDHRPIVVIRSPLPRGRLLSECIALAEARGSTVTLDHGSMKDVEESAGKPQPAIESAVLGVVPDSNLVIKGERQHLRREHGRPADTPPCRSIRSPTIPPNRPARISGECSAKGVGHPFDDLLIGVCALERGYAWQPEITATSRESPASLWSSCNVSFSTTAALARLKHQLQRELNLPRRAGE